MQPAEPTNMTDREMLIEILNTMRAVAQALDTFSKSPMMGAFFPGK